MASLIERQARHGMTSDFTRPVLPAPDRVVRVEGIYLDAVTAPVPALGGQNGAAHPKEGIQYNVSAGSAVRYGIGNQRHRFHRRVELGEIPLFTRPSEALIAPVVPDV